MDRKHMGLLAHTALQAAQPPTTRSGWIRQAEETVSSSSGATAPPTRAAGDRLVGEEREKPGAPSRRRGAGKTRRAVISAVGSRAEGATAPGPGGQPRAVASGAACADVSQGPRRRLGLPYRVTVVGHPCGRRGRRTPLRARPKEPRDCRLALPCFADAHGASHRLRRDEPPQRARSRCRRPEAGTIPSAGEAMEEVAPS